MSQYSQENTCARVSFWLSYRQVLFLYPLKTSENLRFFYFSGDTKRKQAPNFIKKETLPQMFSCKICGIFKNTFFEENLQTTASTSMSKSCLLKTNAISES